MSAIYIHFPFCKSRCVYCAFYSTTQNSLYEEYIDAVISEFDRRFAAKFTPPYTIYFGGGTPSSLPITSLQRIVNHIVSVINQNDILEWTIECNPDDITEEMAKWIASSPINRVSLGIQSLNNKYLKWANRRHTAQKAIDAYHLIRRHGINNVSIDLMFGFPEQTLLQWEEDIINVVKLKPEHISAYALTIEEDTTLHTLISQGTKCASDDLCRDMYNMLNDILADSGYEHYEISNFSLPGLRSKHNSSYWNQTPYLGIGAAAHSYDGKYRSWNISNLQQYIVAIRNNTPDFEYEAIGPQEYYNDCIATMLRTADGLPLNILSIEQYEYMMLQAQQHLENGTLYIKDNHMRLSPKAWFVSDNIIVDLIMSDE